MSKTYYKNLEEWKKAGKPINSIVCCDCIEGLKEIPDNYVDLVVTSPPYNIGGNNMISYERNKRKSKSKYLNYDDNMDKEEYFNFLKKVIYQLLRIVNKYSFFNIAPLSNNKDAVFKLMGLYYNKIKEILIWNKKYGVPAIEKGVLNFAYEFIIVFSEKEGDKRKFNFCNFERGKINNVFEFKKRYKEEQIKEHNAVFPLELPTKLMKMFSNPNDLVLDPFLGSGTTAVACKRLNRNFLGFEINPDYCKIAVKRLEQENIQTWIK